MSVWRPEPSPIRYVFAVLPLLSIGGAIWLWAKLAERASLIEFDAGVFLLGLALFLTLLLAGLFAYLAWCLFSIEYRTSKTQLTIASGGVRHVVPLSAIKSVYPPGAAQDVRKSALPGIPGYYLGGAKSTRLGRVVSVATVPPSRQVLVVTPGLTFALSPRDAVGFVRRLEERSYLDELDDLDVPTGDDSVRVHASGPSAWAAALWADRPARALLLAGLGLNLLLFLYMSLVYSGLPHLLPLHWNAQAQVDWIGDPSELLRLPVFALGVWWINVVLGWMVLGRERAATLFLLAGAVAAQVVFAAGALSIIARAS